MTLMMGLTIQDRQVRLRGTVIPTPAYPRCAGSAILYHGLGAAAALHAERVDVGFSCRSGEDALIWAS